MISCGREEYLPKNTSRVHAPSIIALVNVISRHRPYPVATRISRQYLDINMENRRIMMNYRKTTYSSATTLARLRTTYMFKVCGIDAMTGGRRLETVISWVSHGGANYVIRRSHNAISASISNVLILQMDLPQRRLTRLWEHVQKLQSVESWTFRTQSTQRSAFNIYYIDGTLHAIDVKLIYLAWRPDI
jgi:hypothetical protein